MPTVLVVEDQAEMLGLIRLYLQEFGFDVLAAAQGGDAVELFRSHPVDLVLLDIMLPGMDGWEVCRAIRQHSFVPIIMVTAKAEEIDRILGLELGADDYIIKPFSPRELVARVRALLRRVEYGQAQTVPASVTVGELTVDVATHRALLAGRPLELTPKEFDLLAFLVRHPGQVFTREQLLDRIWGHTFDGSYRTVDALIKRLRRKIEDDPENPCYIETIRGVGYRCLKP